MVNYENWHSGAKIQDKIISYKNYTYRFLIKLVDKYLNTRVNVLDVGCGVGTVDFFIVNKVKSITGTDISKNSIRVANLSSKALGLEKKMKFYKSDFPEEKQPKQYDLVICSEVLEHLADDELAVKRIYSLLKKNGSALFSVPLITAPLYTLRVLNGFDNRVGHLRRYTVEELTLLLKGKGFKIIETVKTEGVLRNFFFTFKIGAFPVRLANKYNFISDSFTLIDNLLGELFGFSNVYIIVQK